MPPKQKKAKPKPKPKAKPKPTKQKIVKSIARGSGAQAQTTSVVVKVGDMKKPAPRRRAPAKRTGPPPPPNDGWLPPQNLTRSGSIFAPAETIRYVPTPATTSLFAGPPQQPTTFTQATQMPEPTEMSGTPAEFAPEPLAIEDAQINQAIIEAERTLAGIPKTPVSRPRKELDWTDISQISQIPFIRPTISGKPLVEQMRRETPFVEEKRQEQTFASSFRQPQFPETPISPPAFEEPIVEEPIVSTPAPLAILPATEQPPEFNVENKAGRKSAIDWYFNNMKGEGESKLPQATRSLIIRKALTDIGSEKSSMKKVGIDKLNEKEQNAVLSILQRINSGETITF